MQRCIWKPAAIGWLALVLVIGGSFGALTTDISAQGTNRPKPPAVTVVDLSAFCSPVAPVPPGPQLVAPLPTPIPSSDGAPVPGQVVRPVGTPYPTPAPQSIPAGTQLLTPDPLLLSEPLLQTDSVDPADAMMWGRWQMPSGSSLKIMGEDGRVAAVDGPVAVVSCGGDLHFSRADGPAQETVAANWGLVVDDSYTDGVYVRLSAMTSSVWIVAFDQTMTPQVDVVLLGEGPGLLACGPATCWSWFNADYSVDGGGPCAASRCYGR